jgi:tight adherence protein C
MTVLAYFVVGVAVLTAVAFAVAVFLFIPSKRPATVDVGDDVVQAPQSVAAQQTKSLSGSLAGAAPKGYIAWIERQIVLAARPAGWTVSRVLVWKIVLGIVAVLLSLGLLNIVGLSPFPVILAFAGTVMMFFLPDVMINSRAHDRQEAITLALPDTLDQMTIAVEAGLGFDSAMAKAARNGTGPLPEELVRVLQDMSIGRTRRDSFLELERRSNSEDLRRFIRAILQADAYGVAIGDVLRVQAAEMRLKRRQRAEERAQKVTVKILFPLVFCLLPVMFIVILTPAVIGIIEQFSTR